jgi:hypothetical protein
MKKWMRALTASLLTAAGAVSGLSPLSKTGKGLLFLSNDSIPTPCVLIDLDHIRRHTQSGSEQLFDLIMPRSKRETLKFCPIAISSPDLKQRNRPIPLHALSSRGAIYFHSRVLPSLTRIDDDKLNVRLDLSFPFPGFETQLVLGVNNHHVGPYYWARMTGTGRCAEAPGVTWKQCGDYSSLQWSSSKGFVECNSNDGKRSEWVPFLRKGDTVQLVPTNPEKGVPAVFEWIADTGAWPLYGISTSGRPLGSDPLVICQWSVQQD